MHSFLGFILALSFVGVAGAAPVDNTIIKGLPTIAVEDSIANHAVEKRGFVKVPWDYERSARSSLYVFYRWIPSTANATAPTLVFMNGGPGFASSTMRSLDYDYTAMPSDKLTLFLTKFNVVLVDQRGTGYTYPMDQSNLRRISLKKIADNMNADVLAMDHARVVNDLIARDLIDRNNFYVMGHSFGLHIAQSYARLVVERKIALQPKGMILSGGQLNDPAWTWIGARPNLEKFSHGLLAYSVQAGREPLDRLMTRGKAHFGAMGVDPNIVHYAYNFSITGDYEADYEWLLEWVNLKNRDEVEAFLREYSDVYGALNPVLSIQSLNGGRLAADLLAIADKYHHLEDWMIDPLKAFAIDDTYLPKKHRMLRKAVRNGDIRMLTPTNGDHFRAFMANTKVMFHWGNLDLIAGAEVGKQMVVDLLGEEKANEVTFLTSGGHADIRTQEGLNVIQTYFGL